MCHVLNGPVLDHKASITAVFIVFMAVFSTTVVSLSRLLYMLTAFRVILCFLDK